MILSKTCGYALRGILYIARPGWKDKNIGIKEISEALDIPKHFLGKIMQELVKKEIIQSTKGPNGGFSANEETLNTPVIKVIEAIDGLHVFKKCALGLKQCNDTNPCALHSKIKTHVDQLLESFSNSKIKDLITEEFGERTFQNISL